MPFAESSKFHQFDLQVIFESHNIDIDIDINFIDNILEQNTFILEFVHTTKMPRKGLSKSALNLLKLYAKLCIRFPEIKACDSYKC